MLSPLALFFFFFQAEDGIRDVAVTGVQTCALPIWLHGTNVKQGATKRELAEQLREDIRAFKERAKCDRLVMIWCASTEVFISPGPAHKTLKAFERAMDRNDPTIAPSMLYAWAALMEDVPLANGAPNLTVDTLAVQGLARGGQGPVAGKDFKTGQTLMKTVISPMLKARGRGGPGGGGPPHTLAH